MYEASDEILLDDAAPKDGPDGYGTAEYGIDDHGTGDHGPGVFGGSGLVPRTRATLFGSAPFTGPETSPGPTPVAARTGAPIQMSWVWFATSSSLFGVVIGGLLFSIGLGLAQAILATIIGVAIAGVVLAVGTASGAHSGLPDAVTGPDSGTPARTAAALVLIARIVAAASLLAVIARAVATAAGSDESAIAVLVVVAAAAAAGAAFGYRVLVPALLVAAVLSAILLLGFVAVTVARVDLRVAATVGEGPTVLVFTGVVVVVSVTSGHWLVGGADLGRYQRARGNGTSSAAWAVCGAVVPAIVIVTYGAMLVASDPALAQRFRVDPVGAVVADLPAGLAVPFAVAIALGAVLAATVVAYSSGFAAHSALPFLGRPVSSIAAAVVSGLVASALVLSGLSLVELIREVSTTAAVPLAAWAGVRTGRMLRQGTGTPVAVRRREVALLVAAVVIGFGLTSTALPGLQWQGYLFALASAPVDDEVVAADLGVLAALVVGLGAVTFAGTGSGRGRAHGSHRERATASPQKTARRLDRPSDAAGRI